MTTIGGRIITMQCDEPVTQLHIKPGMTVNDLVNGMGKPARIMAGHSFAQ